MIDDELQRHDVVSERVRLGSGFGLGCRRCRRVVADCWCVGEVDRWWRRSCPSDDNLGLCVFSDDKPDDEGVGELSLIFWRDVGGVRRGSQGLGDRATPIVASRSSDSSYPAGW
jgi:hypothetical protein